ncbi:Uncharacterised protein [Mycobacterium tuberculosis]|nr:Uncharacterised protein [Mycobacterium tuberculosis]
MALVLDPEAFILGGEAAHPALLDAIERVAEEFSAQLPLRLLASAFGPEAPLVGAVGEAAAALRAEVFTRLLTPSRPPTGGR